MRKPIKPIYVAGLINPLHPPGGRARHLEVTLAA